MSGPFLCVGDIDVDLFVSVKRLPGADDKVSGRRICQSVGGMAANVAVGLRRLGSEVRLVAAIGEDEQGALAEREVARHGIDTGYLVRRVDDKTFMCVVLVDAEGEKSLIRMETDAYLPNPEDVPDAAFVGAGHVHLTLGSEDLARHCIQCARSSGATVSLDLEMADLPGDPVRLVDILPGVDWLFLNRRTRRHVESVLGPSVLDAVSCVITTDGASGCRIERGNKGTNVAGHRVRVCDTTGAGDGLVAAFLHGHLGEGLPEAEALRRASAAAALVVQRFGAQTGLPTNPEIDRFLLHQALDAHPPMQGASNA